MRVTAMPSICLASLWMLTLIACAPTTPPPQTAVAQPFQLAQPDVRIEADPAPPFTYWAPAGSIIRNHANPGIWVAFLNGRNVATYFGDQCHASDWQHLVGAPLSRLPPAPEGTSLRTSCASCAVNSDLRPNRINVRFEEATSTIVEIACY